MIAVVGSRGQRFFVTLFNSVGTPIVSRTLDLNGQSGPNSTATGVAFLPDGSLVVGGYISDDLHLHMVLARLDPALVLLYESTLPEFETLDSGANTLALQPDGKVVLAGSLIAPSGQSAVLVRFDASSGQRDAGFGSDGIVTAGPEHLYFDALALHKDGSLLAAGGATTGIGVAKFTPSGGPDTSFGTLGSVITTLPGNVSFGDALVVQEDGKPVVAGITGPATALGGQGQPTAVVLARYLASGPPDETYAPGGVWVKDLSGNGAENTARAAILQPSGRLVVAGDVFDAAATLNAFFLARFSPAGPADLGLTLQAKQTAKTGSDLTYTLTVRNAGPDTAYDIVLTDAIPVDTVFVSASSTQGSCTTPAVGDRGGLTCRLGALFANATSPATLTIAVTARIGTTIVDAASAWGAGADADPFDNTAVVFTHVTGPRK
jgi:uncharacterized repeat protein (TIGR01451 family)/uncharacterized delta-60 repeat protein